MYLIAVDCDGTVDASNGPVPLGIVMELASKHHVFVIGNKALSGITGLPCAGSIKGLFVSGLDYPGGKPQALRDWAARNQNMERYIVVDDDPNQYGGEWGKIPLWEFLSPRDFLREYAEGRL